MRVRARANMSAVVEEFAAEFAAADAALAELPRAASSHATSERAHWLRLRPVFARSLEHMIVQAWLVWFVATRQPTRASRPSGACDVRQCRASRVRVRLFTTDARYASADAESFIVRDVEALDGRSLHACTAFCMRTSDQRLHYREITASASANGLTILDEADGRVYWCDRHGKAHVCDERCAEGETDERGAERCALSRRLLGSVLQPSFGDGSRDAPPASDALAAAAVAASVRTPARERVDEKSVPTLSTVARSSVRRRASSANAFHERLDAADEIELIALPPPRKRSRASSSSSSSTSSSSSSSPSLSSSSSSSSPSPSLQAVVGETERESETTSVSKHALVDVHVDDPRVRTFPQLARGNTFGDEIGHAMRIVYGQCYTAVHLVYFSEQRAAIEERRAAVVDAEVEYVLREYLAESERPGVWISHDEARRRADAARGTRRSYSFLVLPEGAVVRLTAYYAMLALEFFWSIRPLARRVVRTCTSLLESTLTAKRTARNAKLASRAREVASYFEVATRLQTYTASDATPIILELARRGFRELLVVFFERDPLLEAFACETSVLQQLYVNERTCTQIMRDIKQTVAAARDLGFSLQTLVSTQMPLADVLDARTSVVELFLERRRGRLALT